MDIMRILVMRFDGFIELLSSNSRHAGDHVQDHFFVVGFAVSYTPPHILMDSIRSPDTPDGLLMDS